MQCESCINPISAECVFDEEEKLSDVIDDIQEGLEDINEQLTKKVKENKFGTQTYILNYIEPIIFKVEELENKINSLTSALDIIVSINQDISNKPLKLSDAILKISNEVAALKKSINQKNSNLYIP